MAYELPKLDYDYNALEPHIDAQTMEIHHTKHHQAYITNLNKALTDANIQAPANIIDLIQDLSKIPESIRTIVRNNGGGHANHSFFWKHISPNAGGEPSNSPIAEAINKSFGNFNTFKEQFTKAAISRFGSGWAWLCVNKDRSLFICSTANQDHPLMAGITETVGIPVIGVDVWEHAYYLKYQNRRADYLNSFWNVICWKRAGQNYLDAIQ